MCCLLEGKKKKMEKQNKKQKKHVKQDCRALVTRNRNLSNLHAETQLCLVVQTIFYLSQTERPVLRTNKVSAYLDRQVAKKSETLSQKKKLYVQSFIFLCHLTVQVTNTNLYKIKNHRFLLYSYMLNHFLLIPTGWNQ